MNKTMFLPASTRAAYHEFGFMTVHSSPKYRNITSTGNGITSISTAEEE